MDASFAHLVSRGAHSRPRGRRTRHAAGAVVLACAAVAVAVLLMPTVAGHSAPAPAAVPDGWRWEAYQQVEALIPADWQDGTTNQPYCLGEDKAADRPGEVGRPRDVPMIACPLPDAPPSLRRPHLWFGTSEAVGAQTLDAGWVKETRVVAGVRFTVLSDDAAELRRIVDSARPISAGASGGRRRGG